MKQKDKSPENDTWFDKLSAMKKDLLCVGALLLIVYLLFFQVIFSGYIFSNETDTASQESWSKAMVHISETEHADPLWIPYIFCGMPVFGPLLFPRDVNYIEQIFRLLCTVLFPTANTWFVPHIFLAGFGMYLLGRALRFNSLPSLFASLVVMLNPYVMGLPRSGHGSKLAVLSLLPFVFLL